MRTEYEEECEEEEGEEKCRTEFDYVCEEAKPTTYAPPTDSYGVPSAPPLASSTYGSIQRNSDIGSGETTELPELPQYRYHFFVIILTSSDSLICKKIQLNDTITIH